MYDSLENLQYLTPEWIVCGTILILILARLSGIEDRKRITEIATLGLLAAILRDCELERDEFIALL